jgi:hypothetical protein
MHTPEDRSTLLQHNVALFETVLRLRQEAAGVRVGATQALPETPCHECAAVEVKAKVRPLCCSRS